jgi:chromate transporter
VNAASLSLMTVMTWQLGRAALGDWLTVALLIAGMALLMRYHLNSAWLVFGGGIVGLLLHGRV